jgi:hypothetical protein
MRASGAITAGYPVMYAGDAVYQNNVKVAPASASGASVIGYARETASDGETINVRIRI